jgi:hypothetical protein
MVFLVALWLSYKIAQRLIEPTMSYPPAAIAAVLSIGAAGVALYYLLRALGPIIGTPFPPSFYPAPNPGPNGNNTPPGHSTPPGNNPTSGPKLAIGLPWALPWWVAYVVLGAAAVAVVLVVLPLIVERFEGEEGEPESGPGANADEVRRAVASTLAELESGPGTDPRGAIVRLYGRLLDRILRRFGEVEPLTAREIERYCVSELGARPRTARELTELFEEARYSTRPMGAGEVDRARAALGSLLRDIARETAPG